MNIFVNTYNAIEGFHRWKEANGIVKYLSNEHRHIFVIRCSFLVSHSDREIEINTQQAKIEKYLHENFGTPCMFDGMSCENIANVLMDAFEKYKITKCQVLEDGYGGSTLTR